VNAKRFGILIAFLAVVRPAGGGGRPELKYVAIVSRHGVRSPTWENARLNAYSAEPWPEWNVPPGYLTPHGREAMAQMGSYDREWLVAERLLRPTGCQDARRTFIWADKDQRTFETARALSEALLPGCGAKIHQRLEGATDPIFSGFGSPDAERALEAIRERIGPDPKKLVAEHRAALETLQSILGREMPGPETVGASAKGRSLEITGPLTIGSTFSECLLLEYANGFEGPSLGWGRLTRKNLDRVMEIHALYADLARRTSYIARARGSDLLFHLLNSLDQAVTGKAARGALGNPGDRLLVLAGHDTNLSNLSGMLGLSWKLAGYQPDDTPPGGALIYSLWRDPATGQYSMKLRYTAQSLEQMRDVTPLSLAVPPESQDLSLLGCATMDCPWETVRELMRKAIDPAFVEKE
jgi:4-phytase / acid phosphatase